MAAEYYKKYLLNSLLAYNTEVCVKYVVLPAPLKKLALDFGNEVKWHGRYIVPIS